MQKTGSRLCKYLPAEESKRGHSHPLHLLGHSLRPACAQRARRNRVSSCTYAHGRPNRARLRSALFDYIEIFYNREQAQTGLGHLSPLDYEAALVVA